MSGGGGFAAPAESRLVRLLGRGQLLDVALVERDGAALVAKRARRGADPSEGAAHALVREAKALSLLDLPGVPRLVEVGADDAGPFVLETRLRGLSLRELGESWGGRVPTALAAHVAARAALLLDALHRATRPDGGPLHLVHGDLSRAHLVLGPQADVGLLDFGASSSSLHDGPSGARGTLPYVAPELARGESSSTQATDRYALAVLLAELVSGASLSPAADEAAALLAIGEHGHRVERLDATCLPDALANALREALAFEPAARPGDLGPLLDALGAVVGGADRVDATRAR